MERAWAFYRRSTDKQELSIEDQRKACQKRAAEMGCEIVKEFAPPKGYASGLSIEKDESFQSMVRLAEARTHGVKCLLIYDVSRFGRIPPKAKFYWEEHFRRCGIQIVYTAEHFNYDGFLGDEIHQFVSQMRRFPTLDTLARRYTPRVWQFFIPILPCRGPFRTSWEPEQQSLAYARSRGSRGGPGLTSRWAGFGFWARCYR